MVFSIRTKLFMGFGLTLFFVTILGGTGWWCITTLLSKLQNLHSDSAQLSTAQNALWQLRYGFPQFMVLGEEDRKKIAAEIQTVMYDQAPGIPWGQFAQPAAYRANLRGLIPSAIPIFWNVEK